MAIAFLLKIHHMQKKSIILTAIGATVAAAITIYYLRKKRMALIHHTPSKRKGKHPVETFTRAKGFASGEFTL